MLKRLALLLPLLLISILSGHAQVADIAVGGGGNTLGHTSPHGSFIASASAHLGPYFSIGAEYAYQKIDGALATTEPYTTYSASPIYVSASISEYVHHLQNYGAVWRAGFPHRHAAQSYLLLAGGGLRLSDRITSATYTYPPGSTTASVAVQKLNGAYFGAGGGVSIPIHAGYGLRPEFRYERQMIPEYLAGGFNIEGSHANQVLFTVSLYKNFGH